MASIDFNSLRNISHNQQNYTYVDFYLDFTTAPIGAPVGRDIIRNSLDIRVSYDVNAIRNSIVNLLNTSTRERLLLPDYGCDLRQYVFENATESNGRRIGREIQESIARWEPRVSIIDIIVGVNEDQQYYEIDLNLQVPFAGERFTLTGLLNRQGFTTRG